MTHESAIVVFLTFLICSGFDGIVLSAFGCGAFRNPPDHIARLFKSVCDEFTGCFRVIAFAILEDHNSARNAEGNVLPFER